MSWPSIEKALIAYLHAETGAKTATKTPDNVELIPRFIRISKGPGSDDLVTESTLVDVESFTPETGQSPDYGSAVDFAEEIRQTMHRLSGCKAGTVLIDRVRTSASPMWVDYRNPATNRFVASYRIEFRQT